MSVGYFATLAGERGKIANANWQAAHNWQKRADQLENALLDEQDKNWRLQHELNEARELNASWQAHAQQLKEQIRNWQQSALEYEAMNRAKSAVVEDKFGKGIAELAEIDSATAEKYFEEKKQELIQEWGINPWKTDKG